MKEYVKKGREMFFKFKEALKESKSIQEAAEKCDFEFNDWDSCFEGTEVIVQLNLTEGDTTINVEVAVDYLSCENYLYDKCEVVDPETDDWDGEVYFFTEA